MKFDAPLCIARIALSTVPCAVIMMTGVDESRSRISSNTSRPLRSGREMSSNTMS